MIQLLAMDIDYTITSKRNHIPLRNILAIRRAFRQGVTIVLASGRPEESMFKVARRLGIDKHCFIISLNGSRVIELPSRRVLFSSNITNQVFCELLQIARREQIFSHIYRDGKILTEKSNPYSQFEAKIIGFPIKEVTDLEKEINGSDVVKIMMLESPEKLKAAYLRILPELQGRVSASFSTPFFLDISDYKTDKGTALKQLSEYLKIPQENTMAIGDSFNDKPMIEYAGIGVVMGNACDEMKTCADVIAPLCTKAGVAAIIDKYISL